MKCTNCEGKGVSSTSVDGGYETVETVCTCQNQNSKDAESKYTLAAIETYQGLRCQEEFEMWIKHATILIAEIMRDEVNVQDECEKFLRSHAPKMLAAHYQKSTNEDDIFNTIKHLFESPNQKTL